MKIIILFLSTLLLIFYKFNQIPKNLCFDEIEFAKLSLSLDKNYYVPYSPLATGHTTLYFYILLFSFKIFGLNNFALRFPSALFGVFNVIVFYLIINQIINQIILTEKAIVFKKLDFFKKQWFPFIISLILLTSRWYFNFARFAFEATFLLFLELLSIYFLLRYLANNQTITFILTMFFAGLAFNSYPPGRIFFILPFTLTGFNIIKQWSNRTIKQLIISLFIFFITVFPLITYLMSHSDIRFNQQFFLINSDLSLIKKSEFLGENILKTFLMFFWRGDVNGRHNYPLKPALNPILALFFIVGLTFSLKNFKNHANQFFLFYFLISLIPTLLTYPWENPNMLRSFTAIPSVVFFIGRGVEFLIDTTFVRPVKSGSKKLFLIFLILFLLFLSSLYEIRTYFKYQARVFEEAFEVKNDLKVLIKKN